MNMQIEGRNLRMYDSIYSDKELQIGAQLAYFYFVDINPDEYIEK